MAEPQDWIWMPHPGHFIAADACMFRLCTYVGGFIVSTVGDYKDGEVGSGRLYETMVFAARPDNSGCCPFVMNEPSAVDSAGYNDAQAAREGHMRLCRKWAAREEVVGG